MSFTKINITVVSYSNTLPFKFGIENSDFLRKTANISYDYPSESAKKLNKGLADIGLVPIAAVNSLPAFERISDFCLAGNEKVKSVLLLSDVPYSEIKTVLLDYQSMSSVNLLKIIAKNFIKAEFNYQETIAGFESLIIGTTAGLVIGDRALNLAAKYKYVYDLAEIWFNYTGYKAVFAFWVGKKSISNDFIVQFNKVLNVGVINIKGVVDKYQCENYSFDLYNYLTQCIDYNLDENKLKSAELYWKYMSKL